jgi:hypothetical protein
MKAVEANRIPYVEEFHPFVYDNLDFRPEMLL